MVPMFVAPATPEAETPTMARKTVELGQRYQELNGTLWEVEYVYQDQHGMPHARLRNVRTRVDARTYACAVVADARRFLPVPLPVRQAGAA